MAFLRSIAFGALLSSLAGCGEVVLQDSGKGGGDCPDVDDGNPCTDDACVDEVTSHTPRPAGIDCGNGWICDGAGQCVECLSSGGCPPKLDACAGEMGYPRGALSMSGTDPYRPIVGDLNGDGVPDVAVTNFGELSVVLGRPDGSLGERTDYLGISVPMAFADFTGDGWTDILGFWNDTFVYVNQGDGTFASPVTLASEHFTASAAAADLDGDGDTDVLTLTIFMEYASFLVPFFNDGTGQLTEGPSSPIEAAAVGDSALAVADFDGDGSVDVAIADLAAPVVLVYRNHGDGTFELHDTAEGTLLPLRIFVRDFGGDGRSDVLVSSTTAAEMYTNLGDGTLAKDGGEEQGRVDALADWNLDGLEDAVSFEGGDTIRIRLNDGAGFGNAYDYRSGREVVGGAVTDLNGDGSLDVITLLGGQMDSGGALGVQLGKPDHTLEEPRELWTPGQGWTLAASDLDLDGKTDLLLLREIEVEQTKGELFALRNLGDGTFEEGPAIPLDPTGLVFAVGDVTGDGLPDVVSGDLGESVSVLLGNGDGTFAAPILLAAGDTNRAVALGDLDGDGLREIVTAGEGVAAVLHNEGGGVFGAPVTYSTSTGPNAGVAISDLDGDGRLDVVTARDGVTILWNHSDVALAAEDIEMPDGCGDALATGDLDGDGLPDIVTATGYGDALLILWNRGDGQFEQAVIPQSMLVDDLATADLDADGDLDLTLHHQRVARVSVLENDGAGAFSEPRVYAAGEQCGTGCAGWTSIVVADVIGDGRPDIAAMSPNGGTIALLEGVCHP